MNLTAEDQRLLDGGDGAAAAFAMTLLMQVGRALGATHFISVTGAHVDGCLLHGRVSLDFVEHLVGLGGRVRVPTTLNVGSIDLIHPELFRGADRLRDEGMRLMALHEALGCHPSFTCAPYQTLFRPLFGQQIAWGESNAIVFANSVIGARTARYGDFLDLSAAITGRVPYVGLHIPENRLGRILFRLSPEAAASCPVDTVAVAVGALIGARSANRVPVIDGLPRGLGEDDLKALGAVAASTGSVGMFHAVGYTPEACTRDMAFGGHEPVETIEVTSRMIAETLAQLSTAEEGAPLGAVALGTPHFSLAEFARLMPLLDGFVPASGVDLYVNTGRETFAVLAERQWDLTLRACGFTLVVDTCTYVTSVMRDVRGAVMTNSGKWAHYAPSNIGVDVAFGSLEQCLDSAASGRVTRRR